jgi:hypothetical protein
MFRTAETPPEQLVNEEFYKLSFERNPTWKNPESTVGPSIGVEYITVI